MNFPNIYDSGTGSGYNSSGSCSVTIPDDNCWLLAWSMTKGGYPSARWDGSSLPSLDGRLQYVGGSGDQRVYSQLYGDFGLSPKTATVQFINSVGTRISMGCAVVVQGTRDDKKVAAAYGTNTTVDCFNGGIVVGFYSSQYGYDSGGYPSNGTQITRARWNAANLIWASAYQMSPGSTSTLTFSLGGSEATQLIALPILNLSLNQII